MAPVSARILWIRANRFVNKFNIIINIGAKTSQFSFNIENIYPRLCLLNVNIQKQIRFLTIINIEFEALGAKRFLAKYGGQLN